MGVHEQLGITAAYYQGVLPVNRREMLESQIRKNLGSNKRKVPGRKMFFLAMSLILLITMVLTGCGASSSDNDAGGAANVASSSSGSAAMAFTSREVAAIDDQYGEMDAAAPSDLLASVTSDSKASENGTSATSQIGEPGNAALQALDRKLIYRANVTMEVEDYGRAQTELFNLVSLSGGYMLNFSDSRTDYEINGSFVLKVPASGFQSFLTGLEKLKKGDEFQRHVQGQDVTEEYVDLSSRLKAKQVVETRLLSFMEKATGTKDLLEFSNELARVQEEIERIKGRMRYLDENVTYSTIELRMYEVLERQAKKSAEDANVFERAASAMKDSAAAVLAFLEGLLVVTFGLIPILVFLLIVLIPVWLIIRKTRQNRRERRYTPENQVESKSTDDANE